MKIRYNHGSEEKIFNSVEDTAIALGFKRHMIIKFIEGTAEAYKEYNDRLSWITDEVNEFGTELVIEKSIPGVTDIDKFTGIPVIYTDRNGSVHMFDSLLDCQKHSHLSVNGLISALLNKGKLKGRLRLNNGNELCAYLPESVSLEHSDSWNPKLIDPNNFGDDFAGVFRQEFYDITKDLGKDLDTIEDVEIIYVDTRGKSHEYGTIRQTADYLNIHELEILRALIGKTKLKDRFHLCDPLG